jgi:inosose dehydratase
MKIAGAPISWGVCEVPNWGLQLAADRVLAEMHALGLEATETGPDGFLPPDAAERRAVLARHGLRLVAGFVPIVLHRADQRDAALASAEQAAAALATAGAEVLVAAAATGDDGYDESPVLDDDEWGELFTRLDEVGETADRHGLALALHPHLGTVVEGPDAVDRVLSESKVELCIDTGHLFVGGSDPVAVTEQAAAESRVRHVHLKDVDARLAEVVREGRLPYRDAVRQGLYRPLGEGDVPIAGVVRALEATGYRHWYVIEQDRVLDGDGSADEAPPAADVRISLDYLDQFNHQEGKRNP